MLFRSTSDADEYVIYSHNDKQYSHNTFEPLLETVQAVVELADIAHAVSQ